MGREPKGREKVVNKWKYPHQAIITPIVVYVPLVIQNVAKYRTWLLSGTVRSNLI